LDRIGRKPGMSFMDLISDMLCGQIDRGKKLTLGDLVLSVLPWPFHKDLPNKSYGICSILFGIIFWFLIGASAYLIYLITMK
jgi:hypothetical protein